MRMQWGKKEGKKTQRRGRSKRKLSGSGGRSDMKSVKMYVREI